MTEGCGAIEINSDSGRASMLVCSDSLVSMKSSGKEVTSFCEADCHQGDQAGTKA